MRPCRFLVFISLSLSELPGFEVVYIINSGKFSAIIASKSSSVLFLFLLLWYSHDEYFTLFGIVQFLGILFCLLNYIFSFCISILEVSLDISLRHEDRVCLQLCLVNG